MIRIQDLPLDQKHQIVRFYDKPQPPKTKAPYIQVCTLSYEADNIVWIYGMLAKEQASRIAWRQFIAELNKRHVEYMRATRKEGGRLPKAYWVDDPKHEEGGYYEMRVKDLMARPVDTNFSPLG